jgi:hypothetical protein
MTYDFLMIPNKTGVSLANGLTMAYDPESVQIKPRILKTGIPSTVTISAKWFSEHKIDPPASIVINNVSGRPGQTTGALSELAYLQEEGSDFQFTHTFPNEGEYLLLLDGLHNAVQTLSLYVLEQDLFMRKPYRGDIHMHSSRSDGRELPSYVAAACRRIGLDFMALTDHWQYTPSLEAVEAFRDLPVDLRIYPGEEIHIPAIPVSRDFRKVINPIHIVNFGGSFSINDWIRDNESAFDREVISIIQQLTGLPPHLEKRIYAECEWCFNKIREGGGLGIFCHPYWINKYRYDVPETLTNLLLERQPFDALELIGGYHHSEFPANHLQVARYHEERSLGKRIPIVGVSDAHGCDTGELFGWYTTLVFSASDNFSDIKQSIMDLYSVAVESVPGSRAVAHGPFRLVKYAQFLLREILPVHDELCREEGLAMQAYLVGDPTAIDMLHAYQGRLADYYMGVFDSG